MEIKVVPGEKRTVDQLRQHYEVEKELANKLRHSAREQRAGLYSQVYDDLFRRVPNHPQWTKRKTSQHERTLDGQIRSLQPYLKPDITFMEVGAGDCSLSLRAAQHVRQVYAVEVSAEVTGGLTRPPNFKLLISNGCDIPLADQTVDVAYSFQLMEHIHPDDASDQLREIHRVLKPGGVYFCVTPNRLSGPHDISMYFDDVATGLHLKEYSIGDLNRIFHQVGFGRVWVERLDKAKRMRLPVAPLVLLENTLELLPGSTRRAVTRSYVFSRLLDASVVAEKPLV
jgi:SAM-dependent methyltransferase